MNTRSDEADQCQQGMADIASESFIEFKESEGYVILSALQSIPMTKPYRNWRRNQKNRVALDAYDIFQAEIYNVNTVFRALSRIATLENYGANSTVNYFAFNFKDLSTFSKEGFPVLSLLKNDFILLEVTIPSSDWLEQHNLLNVTPYFFDFNDTEDNITTNVFASCDNTIHFFNDCQPGAVKKICFTACKSIAAAFEAEGYIVSRIPEEYIDSCTYMHLIRVGILHDYLCSLPGDMCVATYYRAKDFSADLSKTEYFDASTITGLFERPLEPISTPATRELHQSYVNAIAVLQQSNFQIQSTYNYLSRPANVKYAFQSFYDAVMLRPAIEMLGNNTGENYFISDDIEIVPYYRQKHKLAIQSGTFEERSEPVGEQMESEGEYFLYVLSVNQYTSGCGLSSNIQIYDRSNNSVVTDGTYETAPPLSPMSSASYPFPTEESVASYPPLILSKYAINALVEAGVTTITVAERNAYNPRNYLYTSNSYVDTAVFCIGQELDANTRQRLARLSCCIRHIK